MSIDCVKCKLHKYRRNIVEGRGLIPADICIIGEAPGLTEDMLGEAFVGKSGKLLDQIILDSFYNISKKSDKQPSIYFTNTVFCLPCDSIGGSNREPLPEEIFACSENVNNLLQKINSKVYVFAGNIAEKYMKHHIKHYYKIMHPASILRQGGFQSGYYMQTIRQFEQIFREVLK